jgi:hypothetical protein
MAQSRQEILGMVAKGEISAAEAAALLSGNAPVEKAPEPETMKAKLAAEPIPVKEETVTEATVNTVKLAEKVSANSGKTPTWLRIRVNDVNTGKSRVRVNIPLRLVGIGLRLGRGFMPELNGIDWDDTLNHLKDGDNGLIVEVEDVDSGDHVQIFVE